MTAAIEVRRPEDLGRLVAGAAGLAVGIGVMAALAPPAALLLVATPFLLAAVRWLPGVVLGAYVLLPMYKAAVQPLVPIDITVVLAGLNALQLVPVAANRSIGLSRLSLGLWLALGAAITLGAVYAADQAFAVAQLGQWWLLLVAPLVAAVRVAQRPAFVRQLLATAVVISLIAMALAVGLVGGANRVQVLGDNTILTARVVLLAPIIALAGFLSVRSSAAWLALALIPVGLLGAIATGSRGPTLAFFATAAALVLGVAVTSGVSRRVAGVLVLAAGSVAVAVLAADLLPAISIQRFAQLFSIVDEGARGSIAAREQLFGLAIHTFETSPLIGVGTGGFAAAAHASVGLAGYDYPHNTLLQLAAELGVVGAALGGSLVLLALVRPVPPGGAWLAVRGLALFAVVNALVSGSLYDERLLWGLVLLLLAAPTPTRTPTPVPAASSAR